MFSRPGVGEVGSGTVSRRADSKEQHPNQKADKAAVENYVRHRLNGLKVGFCRKSSMAAASP